MNKSSSSAPNVQKTLSGHLPSSIVPEGSTPSLGDFQFTTIGQPPTLLQRMSASGPDIDMSQDFNEESRSPSPDLEDELLISESSPETMNTGQPSLIARIAMSEPTVNAIEKMNVDESMPRQRDSRVNITPSQHNDRGSAGLISTGNPQPIFSKASSTSDQTNFIKAPVTVESKVNLNNSASASSSSKAPESVNSSSNTRHQPDTTTPSTSSNPFLSRSIKINAPLPLQHVSTSHQVSQVRNDTQVNGASSADPNLPSLRDLQKQLSTVVSHVPPINTAEILQLAQSAKDQCAELISSSRKAFELAQQSLASANQSLEVSQHCMRLAENLRTRTDTFSSAVEKLDLGRDKQWADSMDAVVSQLDQRIQIDEEAAREAEVRREQERQAVERTRSLGTSSTGSPSLSKSNVTESSLTNNGLGSDSSVENEAIAAEQELNRLREEDTARRKVEVEELERNKAAQEELKAQLAEIEARAAAIAERARENDEESKRKQYELAQIAKEKQIAAEKEAEKAKRQALLEKKLAAEKESAMQEMAREDGSRKEQEAKRQEIAVDKQRILMPNAKVASTRKPPQIPRQSMSPTRVSKQHSGSTSLAEAQWSSNDPAFSNHASQVTPVTVGPEVPRSKALLNVQRNSIPTDKVSVSTPQSTNVHSMAPVAAHPQSKSTSIATKNGAENNHAFKPASSGLPSPPSEAIETNSVAARTSMPVHRNNSTVSTRKESSNPPQTKTPLAHSILPAEPVTSQIAVDHHEISVNRHGRDAGNLPLLPPSQLTPISPDAQKANLRSLSEHHGIVKRQEKSARLELDERKPLVKTEDTEKKLSFPLSAPPPAADSKSTVHLADQTSRKVKIETPDHADIPRLSVPPSPSSPKFSKDEVLPTFESGPANPPVASQPNIPLPRRNVQKAVSKSSEVDRQDNLLVAPTMGRPSQELVASSLANTAISLAQAPHRHIATNDFFDDADFRMGPDTVVSASQSFAPSPVEAESLEQRRRGKSRAPQNIDHYSPSPPPRSRTPSGPPPRSRQPLPRRGDHYSPPRPYESSGYRVVSPGPSHSHRPGSSNNSRDVSPSGQGEFARCNSTPELQLGRKRTHDEQHHEGPPLRRPRYTTKGPLPERREIGQHALAPPPQYSEDWSHDATYARSPSPDPARQVALSSRINDVNQGQSDYRGGTGQHFNMAQRRHINEYSSTPTHTQLSTFGNNPYPSTSYQRQNHRESKNDTQPHLLSRFTDQGRVNIPLSESSQHHPMAHHRPNRGRPHKQSNPRANPHHPSLEQRISNNNRGPLINRIEQGPSDYE